MAVCTLAQTPGRESGRNDRGFETYVPLATEVGLCPRQPHPRAGGSHVQMTPTRHYFLAPKTRISLHGGQRDDVNEGPSTRCSATRALKIKGTFPKTRKGERNDRNTASGGRKRERVRPHSRLDADILTQTRTYLLSQRKPRMFVHMYTHLYTRVYHRHVLAHADICWY